MAIPILNHLNVKGNINLNDYQLNDFVVDHSTTGDAGNTAGKLIYDSGTLKYYNGSWQSLSTTSGSMSSWFLEDGDGTEVEIDDAKEVKFIEGGGLDINWTDTSNGSDADPYDLTFTLDISGYSTVTPASGDKFLTLDSDGSTEQRTTVDALATLFAGTGLTATNGVIAVDTLNQNTTGSAATLTTSRNIAATGDIAWNVDFDGSGDVTAAATIQSAAVEASMLNNNIISGKTALTTGLASTDELMISDAGTVKRMDVSVLQSYLQSNLTFTSNTNTGADMTEGTLRTKLAAITENVTIGDATDVQVTTSGNLVVTGDLTVSGDTITANVGTLDVEDKNITVNKSSGDSSSTADGAGLTIQDAVNASTDATMLWDATNDEFDFSHPINVTGKVTATGTSVFASLDISGDVDVDGTLETDALSLNGTSVTSTATELNYLDGTTLGTVVASKAVAVDSNKDVTGFRNVTLTGELDAATGDFSGNVDVDGTLEADAITVNGTALNTVIDNRIKVVQKTATVDVSSLVNNVFKCNIAHNMNSNNLIVKLYDGTTYLDVFADIDRTDANTLQITFSHEPTNDIVVVIQEIIGDNIAAGSDITYPTS